MARFVCKKKVSNFYLLPQQLMNYDSYAKSTKSLSEGSGATLMTPRSTLVIHFEDVDSWLQLCDETT